MPRRTSLISTLVLLALTMQERVPARLTRSKDAKTSVTGAMIPLYFERNQGQTDSQVQFLARGSGFVSLLSPNDARFVLYSRIADNPQNSTVNGGTRTVAAIEETVIGMELVDAKRDFQMVGLRELPGKINYFRGADNTSWLAGIPTYARVEVRGVYAGIDLVYHGDRGRLEFDFVVAPGADTDAILLKYEGARVSVDDQGRLIVRSGGSFLQFRKPHIFQRYEDGDRRIAGTYLVDNDAVGFQIGEYDEERPLVIDPVLSYSTYLGGTGDDRVGDVETDSHGNVYVVGSTASLDFPTVNPLQGAHGGGGALGRFLDVFVTKMDPSGSMLLYSTYLGGSEEDRGVDLAVDASGNAYLTGDTGSPDFPITPDGFQTTFGGGTCFRYLDGVPVQEELCFDAFATKLEPTGALGFSTYLGGNRQEAGRGIAVDAATNVYVTGASNSDNFPGAKPGSSALSLSCRDPLVTSGIPGDAFIAKLSATGGFLLYSFCFGGDDGDNGGQGVDVDTSGNAYVAGSTFCGGASNIPVVNAYQPTCVQRSGHGTRDAFLTKVNDAGSAFLYSSFLGGVGEDFAWRVAVDGSGHAFVAGQTQDFALENNFPTKNAFQTVEHGNGDVFLAEFDTQASGAASLVYSTYLGGSGEEALGGFIDIALDPAGTLSVVGGTSSTDFPLERPLQTTNAGGFDAFVTRFNSNGSALLFSTYLGGAGDDRARGTAIDSSGKLLVAGTTSSVDFPTANPLQPSVAAGSDGFVAKVDLAPSVTLAINDQHPPSNLVIVPGPGPMTLTLDMDPGIKTDALSWFYVIVVKGQIFWVTPTGITRTPAPLLTAPPLLLDDVTLFSSTLPSGTAVTFVFFLWDGSRIVALDAITGFVS